MHETPTPRLSRFLHASIAVGALAMLAAAGGIPRAEAAPHGFCVAYANTAVAQHRRNVRLGCGRGGPRWHYNWAAHYGWCRTASRSRARREQRARARILRRCAGYGIPVPPPPVMRRTFSKPRIGGLRLDWCKYWARQCGRPAADAYCRRRGYRRAVSWRMAVDIGRWTDTRVIGTGQVCRGNFCDGFRYITCTR